MANNYVLTGFHFRVDWGGTRIGFSEISGLEVETEVIEYREGSRPLFSSLKMPGQVSFADITLKRGMTNGDNEFFEWWNTIRNNTVQRRDIMISLLNEEHEPVVAWKVKNAFPKKVKWADLIAAENKVVIETLVIANEGIQVVK